MSTVPEIEAAVRKLSPAELMEFSAWFWEFCPDTRDRMEEYARGGRLDPLDEEALQDLDEGQGENL